MMSKSPYNLRNRLTHDPGYREQDDSDGIKDEEHMDDTAKEIVQKHKSLYPDISPRAKLHMNDENSKKIYPTLPTPAPKNDQLHDSVKSVTEKDHYQVLHESKNVPNKPKKRDRPERKIHLSVLFGGILVVIAICICISLYYMRVPKMEHNSSILQDLFKDFADKIDHLSQRFPGQDPRLTWRVIRTASRQVLSKQDPEYPMVLLISTPKGSENVGTCLAKTVAKEFSDTVHQPLHPQFYLDIESIKSADHYHEKRVLDDKLKAVFDNGGRAVVLDHLQFLSGEAAFILHAYCDNSNAPYKNVLFILVVNMENKENPDQNSVEELLRKVWVEEINVNNVGALLVRIANNLVPLKPESTFDSSACQA